MLTRTYAFAILTTVARAVARTSSCCTLNVPAVLSASSKATTCAGESGLIQLITPLDGSWTLQLGGPLMAQQEGGDVTKRPGGFRKGVREAVESKAQRNDRGEMICPTCGQAMTKPDLDHTPPWRDRIAKMFGWTRKQVLDEYNDILLS